MTETEQTETPLEVALRLARKLGWELVHFERSTRQDLGVTAHAVVCRVPDATWLDRPYAVHGLYTFPNEAPSGLVAGDYDLSLADAIDSARLRVDRRA